MRSKGIWVEWANGSYLYIKMQQNNFKVTFSLRLRELMKKRGYTSLASKVGVSPTALCKAVNCSIEMALRYLHGKSVPSPEAITVIANWLACDPGYLLFGTPEKGNTRDVSSAIEVEKNTLAQTIKEFFKIEEFKENHEEYTDLLVSIIFDASKISSEDQCIRKIVSMAIKPLRLSKEKQRELRE